MIFTRADFDTFKATGLERTREIISDLIKDIDEAKSKLPAIEESVQKKIEIFKKLKAELVELEALGRYELDIRLNKAKLLWLEVQDMEASVAEVEGDAGTKREQLHEASAALEDAERQLMSTNSIDSVKDQMNVITAEREAVMEDFEQKSRSALAKQKEVDQIKMGLKNLTRGEADFTARIKSTSAQVSGTIDIFKLHCIAFVVVVVLRCIECCRLRRFKIKLCQHRKEKFAK